MSETETMDDVSEASVKIKKFANQTEFIRHYDTEENHYKVRCKIKKTLRDKVSKREIVDEVANAMVGEYKYILGTYDFSQQKDKYASEFFNEKYFWSFVWKTLSFKANEALFGCLNHGMVMKGTEKIEMENDVETILEKAKKNKNLLPKKSLQRVAAIYHYLYLLSDRDHPIDAEKLYDYFLCKTTEKKRTLRDSIDEIIEYENKLGVNHQRIHKEKKGTSYTYYFDHQLSQGDMYKVFDSIICSSRLDETSKNELVTKLSTLPYISSVDFYQQLTSELSYSYSLDAMQVVSRLDGESSSKLYDIVYQNLSILIKSIVCDSKVRFTFHKMDAKGNYIPLPHSYELSAVHIVVYHERYYVIGMMDGFTQESIYRVDLMRDIEFVESSMYASGYESRNLEKLPDALSKQNFNPQLYMQQHMYMYYGNVSEITFRIKNDNYVFIQDWFLGNFESCEDVEHEGFDIVRVQCVEDAFVNFAMQYGNKIKVLTPLSLVEKIQRRIQELKELYD